MAKEEKNRREKKHFFRDFKAELKKVIWPTSKQLVNNTIAVITIVLVTAAIVFVLDFLFIKLNTYGIDKLKKSVESKNAVVVEENTNDTTTETSNEDTATENVTAE